MDRRQTRPNVNPADALAKSLGASQPEPIPAAAFYTGKKLVGQSGIFFRVGVNRNKEIVFGHGNASSCVLKSIQFSLESLDRCGTYTAFLSFPYPKHPFDYLIAKLVDI